LADSSSIHEIKSLLEWNTDGLTESSSIRWVDLVEKGEHFLLDVFIGDCAQRSSEVLDEMISVSIGEDVVPKASWLLEMIVLDCLSSALTIGFFLSLCH